MQQRARQITFALTALTIASTLFIGQMNMGRVEASTDAEASATLGTPFNLAYNQTVSVADTDISVTFLNVTEDSRCPADVVCVWEGQVTVVVGIAENTTDLGRFNLTLGGGGNSSMAVQMVGSYTINLTQVQPYPIASQPTELSDYVATMVISSDDAGPVMLRSVLLKAAGNSTEGPGIAALIKSWSVERGSGVAIVVMRDEDMSLSRFVASFTPTEAECMNVEMADCVDAEITSVTDGAPVSEGDIVHFEIDGDNTMIIVSVGSDDYELEIRKHKEVSKPIVI